MNPDSSKNAGQQAVGEKSTPPGPGVQGEGDYEAARRYRKEVRDFLDRADVDELAQESEPQSLREAEEMMAAENQGRERSRGDDPADIDQMRGPGPAPR